MNEPITRRRAIGAAGTLFLGAGLLAAGGAPAPAAAAILDIDRAERLCLELRDVMLRLDDRHRSNIGHVLDLMSRAGGLTEAGASEALAEIEEHVGPGNRVHDRIDRQEAAEKRAAVTHAALVARYAAAYHAGGIDAGTAIRAELAEAHGEDLGHAIAGAAFDLYLHELYHDGAA